MLRHFRQLFLKGLATLTISVLMSGCASLPQPCLPPSRMMASAEMLFGLNIDDRRGIGESVFANFVAREITPRFPDGLTVIDGRGQWRDSMRDVYVHERTKVVLVTFADDAQRRADLATIAESYKRQFSQQSVLTKISSSCVSF